MPSALTYPGVYIEEIPSGVRTITGVATSIAAFVGWASKGPTDKAQRILSWSDFERKFGGMDPRSLLGYAVYNFFANGGRDAYVIRLANEPIGEEAVGENSAVAAQREIDGKLTLTAVSPGEWGNHYGFYQRGDYWLIPARTATGDVEWPYDSKDPDGRRPLPPHGIDHHYAPLAVIVKKSRNGNWEQKDCRCSIVRALSCGSVAK